MRGVKPEHLVTPEVLCHLDGQGLGIIIEGEIQRLTVLQGLSAKTATAEAMNRGDVGPLQCFQCFQQSACQQSALTGILSVLFKPAFQH